MYRPKNLPLCALSLNKSLFVANFLSGANLKNWTDSATRSILLHISPIFSLFLVAFDLQPWILYRRFLRNTWPHVALIRLLNLFNKSVENLELTIHSLTTLHWQALKICLLFIKSSSLHTFAPCLLVNYLIKFTYFNSMIFPFLPCFLENFLSRAC